MEEDFAAKFLGVNTFTLRRFPDFSMGDVTEATWREWQRRPQITVEEAEAGQGWLGMAADRVEARLEEADVETLRSFIGDMVRVMVYPVGRGRRLPVKERIKVQYLVAGRGSDPAEAVEAPMPGWGEPVYLPVETAPADQLPKVINPHGVPVVGSEATT